MSEQQNASKGYHNLIIQCYQTPYSKADVVRLGEHNYNNDNDRAAHEDFNVEGTVLYPSYNHPEAYHDLALLRLASRVVLKVSLFHRGLCNFRQYVRENVIIRISIQVFQ